MLIASDCITCTGCNSYISKTIHSHISYLLATSLAVELSFPLVADCTICGWSNNYISSTVQAHISCILVISDNINCGGCTITHQSYQFLTQSSGYGIYRLVAQLKQIINSWLHHQQWIWHWCWYCSTFTHKQHNNLINYTINFWLHLSNASYIWAQFGHTTAVSSASDSMHPQWIQHPLL